MTQLAEDSAGQWHWQDYISTYRYWALVLASFLLAVLQYGVMSSLPVLLMDSGFSASSIGLIFSLGLAGSILGTLFVLYFMRRHLKWAFVLFAALVLMGTTGVFFVSENDIVAAIIFRIIASIGHAAFTLAVLAALVAGRPDMKSFTVAVSSVLIWQIFAAPLNGVFVALIMNGGETWHKALIAGVIGLIAILLLVFMKGRMFSVAPETDVKTQTHKSRSPILVFLLATFIPFYLLYWLFRRPAELKSLRPDLRLPSRGGVLATALFAPFILPIWFHNIRQDLGEELPTRSPGLIGVISFVFPSIAAAMAQSDTNLIAGTGEAFDL